MFHRRSGEGRRDPAPSTATDAADDMPGQTAVIFSVPEKRLSAMDVATGPCVPAGGRKHALVSVHQQEGPERPEQITDITQMCGRPLLGKIVSPNTAYEERHRTRSACRLVT